MLLHWYWCRRVTNVIIYPYNKLGVGLASISYTPSHKACDIYASLVRPYNWPSRRLRLKRAQTVALVVQRRFTGCLDIAIDVTIVVKFWTWSNKYKCRQGGWLLKGYSNKLAKERPMHCRGYRKAPRRSVGQWSPVRSTSLGDLCHSIVPPQQFWWLKTNTMIDGVKLHSPVVRGHYYRDHDASAAVLDCSSSVYTTPVLMHWNQPGSLCTDASMYLTVQVHHLVFLCRLFWPVPDTKHVPFTTHLFYFTIVTNRNYSTAMESNHIRSLV